jgi:hypothetical protein
VVEENIRGEVELMGEVMDSDGDGLSDKFEEI